MFENCNTQLTSERDDIIDLANLTEVGKFMSRVFDKPEGSSRVAVASVDERDPGLELDQVETLLNKACNAIEVLAARCAIMEQELAERDEHVAEHEQAAKQWQVFAVKLQAQTANDQNTIADLTARCDASEARVTSLEAAAVEAQQRCATADAKSIKLQRQVVAAFGRKSPVHSVLQAITLQEAAE